MKNITILLILLVQISICFAQNGSKKNIMDNKMDNILKCAQLKDAKIGYLLSGKESRETILFVHGLGANLSQFEQQQKYFSEKYNVLSVNLRGHGNSMKKQKSSPEEFQLHKMANDVIELLDTLKLKEVHFVGNSMGGNIGYEILKLKPEVLKSFTTYGTTGQLSTSKFTLGMMKFTYRIVGPKTIGNLSKTAGQTKESKAKIKKIMSEVNKPTLLSIIPNLANFNYLNVIKNSNTPTMIIKGEKDKEINNVIESTILEFENRGDFRLIEMEEVGHFANLDNPDLFNSVLEKFISEHSK